MREQENIIVADDDKEFQLAVKFTRDWLKMLAQSEEDVTFEQLWQMANRFGIKQAVQFMGAFARRYES